MRMKLGDRFYEHLDKAEINEKGAFEISLLTLKTPKRWFAVFSFT